jgi:hypothetical protein
MGENPSEFDPQQYAVRPLSEQAEASRSASCSVDNSTPVGRNLSGSRGQHTSFDASLLSRLGTTLTYLATAEIAVLAAVIIDSFVWKEVAQEVITKSR